MRRFRWSIEALEGRFMLAGDVGAPEVASLPDPPPVAPAEIADETVANEQPATEPTTQEVADGLVSKLPPNDIEIVERERDVVMRRIDRGIILHIESTQTVNPPYSDRVTTGGAEPVGANVHVSNASVDGTPMFDKELTIVPPPSGQNSGESANDPASSSSVTFDGNGA